MDSTRNIASALRNCKFVLTWFQPTTFQVTNIPWPFIIIYPCRNVEPRPLPADTLPSVDTGGLTLTLGSVNQSFHVWQFRCSPGDWNIWIATGLAGAVLRTLQTGTWPLIKNWWVGSPWLETMKFPKYTDVYIIYYTYHTLFSLYMYYTYYR